MKSRALVYPGRFLSSCVVAGCLAVSCLPGRAQITGPDGYGYTVIDSAQPGGPTYQFIFVSSSENQVLGPGDDHSSTNAPPAGIGSPVVLGRSFPFYGGYHSRLVPASNGYLSTDPTESGTDISNDSTLPSPIPLFGSRIYVLHDDLVIPDGHGVYYKYFAAGTHGHSHKPNVGISVFQWDNVHFYGRPANEFDFEVLLYDDGDILCQYGLGNPDLGASSTTGLQYYDGSDGLLYAANQANSIPPNFAVLFRAPLQTTTNEDQNDSPAGAELSLREAIRDAPPGGVIRLSSYAFPIAAPLVIPSGKTLGLRSGFFGTPCLVATNDTRILTVEAGAMLTVQGVDFEGGRAIGVGPVEQVGGGIYNAGDLRLENCALLDCRADQQGGGIFSTAGSTLDLAQCRFQSCQAAGDGGGVYHNGDELDAEDCSWADNLAGGEGGGLVDLNSGAHSLLRCTFYKNKAANHSGALVNISPLLTLENCTLADNRAANNGGGIYNRGGMNLVLRHCTLTGNYAGGSGGGVYNLGPLTMENSLVALNQAAGTGADIQGALAPTGINLVRDWSGSSGLRGGTDLQPADPLIASATLAGGDTPTVRLRPGSPAIDAGLATGSSPTTDQCGASRFVNIVPDIGSFESGPVYTVDLKTDEDDGNLSAGDLSFREAVLAAAAAQTGQVVFDPTVFSGLDAQANTVYLGRRIELTNGTVCVDAQDLSGGLMVSGPSNDVLNGFFFIGEDAALDLKGVTFCNTVLNDTAIGLQGSLSMQDCHLNGLVGSPPWLVDAFVTSQTWLKDCVLERCRADSGCYFSGRFRAERCTLASNELRTFGALFVTGNGNLLSDCTVAENGGSSEAGVQVGAGSAFLTSCTITGNRGTQPGSGLRASGESRVTLRNCIVAGNVSPDNPDFHVDPPLNLGYVREEGANLIGWDPQLAPLGLYGGTTPTCPPLAYSRALDAGTPHAALAETDQRGLPRTIDGDEVPGALPDIGSVEAGPALVVNTRMDEVDGSITDGDISLRDALHALGDTPGGRILFDIEHFAWFTPGFSPVFVDAIRGPILVTNELVFIDASGTNVQLDGGGTTELLTVAAGATLNLHQMTFQHAGDQGAVDVNGHLLATECRFMNNTSTWAVAPYRGGALTVTGDAVLRQCRFTGNHSAGDGGAQVQRAGSLEVRACLFEENVAIRHGGALALLGGVTRLCDSTFNRNRADPAGVMGGAGGAVFHPNTAGLLTMVGCTLTANQAIQGGALLNAAPDCRVSFCTLTGNRAGQVGALLQSSTTGLELYNSIVAGNHADVFPNSFGPLSASSHGNLIADIDPLLAPLARYGGPTPTMPPLSGSPAIACAVLDRYTPAMDQRGLPRVVGWVLACQPDCGAAEASWKLVVNTLTDEADGNVGDGDVSLRDALAAARTNWRGTHIQFDPIVFSSTANNTIVLINSLPEVTGSIMIDATAAPHGIQLTADDTVPTLLSCDRGSSLSLHGVALRDITGSSETIFCGGELCLDRCRMERNRSQNYGNILINADASAFFYDCFFRDNRSENSAGVCEAWGNVFFERCTMTGNRGGTAGTMDAASNRISFSMENCTLVDNCSTGDGGALSLTTSGSADLRFCTITGNRATGAGGGLFNRLMQTDLENCIVAGNAAASDPDIRYPVPGAGDIGSVTETAANFIGGDPLLSPLGLYGGLTPTMPPLVGSPVIDAGTSTDVLPLFDQCGFARSQDGDAVGDDAPDLGAVESGPVVMVTTADDSGTGSLREALYNIPAPGSHIQFDPALFTGLSEGEALTISLASPLAEVSSPLGSFPRFIDASDTPGGVTLDAGRLGRIMRLYSGNLAFHSVQFRNGLVENIINETWGGGIRLDQSNLTLAECTVADNTIYNDDFRDLSGGGGIFVGPGSHLWMHGCALHDNIANGAIGTGGGVLLLGDTEATFVQCTLARNQASQFGGGISAINDSPLYLSHCTISDNTSSSYGGGMINESGPDLVIHQTILAGNRSHNDSSDDFFTEDVNPTDSLTDIRNPGLAPLGDYGGRTWTMPSLASSPAIDLVSTNPCVPMDDQRGWIRPVGSAADAGAAEAGPVYVVTSRADSGAGSLRQAVLDAVETGARVLFDPAVFVGPDAADNLIGLTSPIALTDRILRIDATGVPGGIQLDSGGTSDLLVLNGTSRVGLHGLTFSGARNTAVDVNAGSVCNASDCRFIDNDELAIGGSALAVDGRARLTRCQFSGNRSTQAGGAVYIRLGQVDAFDCAFSGNRSLNGGALYLASFPAHLRMSGCTLADNIAEGNGGAIALFDGRMDLVNCTLNGNSAEPGGYGGAVYAQSGKPYSLLYCTMDGNAAGQQGGGAYGGELWLTDSIVAENSAGSGDPNLAGLTALHEGGVNQYAAPLLAPLSDYGGPTPTMLPLPGSPVIGQAAGGVVDVMTDQRGTSRNFYQSELGAVEIRYSDNLPYDGDQDGLPKWYEMLFGLDDRNSADGGLDLDGDGFSALEELAAHTNPRDVTDVLRILDTHITHEDEAGTYGEVTWRSWPGLPYRLEENADLRVDNWQTLAGPTGTGLTTRVEDILLPPGSIYLRIQTP